MTPSKSGSSRSANRKSRTPPSRNRRSEILLEDMHGKMSVIAEGHQMLAEHLVRLDEKLDNLDASMGKRIDNLAGEVQGLRGEVREVRTDIREHIAPRLDDHEARIAALEDQPAA